MAIDGAPSALLDGAPSARLPESEAGVESEAGLEPETGDSLNLKPPAQTAAELVKNNGVDAVHHDETKTCRDLARTSLSPASRSRLFAEIQRLRVGDANPRTEKRLQMRTVRQKMPARPCAGAKQGMRTLRQKSDAKREPFA